MWRKKFSLQRRASSHILSCRNVVTVRTLSYFLVSKGIPFVLKPALDFVDVILFLSSKSIFLYNTVSCKCSR